MRATRNEPKFQANALAAVKALQMAIPQPITFLREPRSASRPSGSAGDGVDHREGGGDDAELEVVEAPLEADRLVEDRGDRAVEEVEQVGEEQEGENPPWVGRWHTELLLARRPGRAQLDQAGQGAVGVAWQVEHRPRDVLRRQPPAAAGARAVPGGRSRCRRCRAGSPRPGRRAWRRSSIAASESPTRPNLLAL